MGKPSKGRSTNIGQVSHTVLMWVKLVGLGALGQFRLTTIFLLNLSHFLSCDDRLFTPGIWALHLRHSRYAKGGAGDLDR